MAYKSKALSLEDIRYKAEIVRNIIEIFTNSNNERLDILRFAENEITDKIDKDFSFIVLPVCEMKSSYGLTDLNDNTIYIREDVYYDACDGNPRAIFTIAHELGHLFLHSNQNIALTRSDRKLKAYEDPEWQANAFAAELLMPISLIDSNDTPFTLSNRFGVSLEAATIRLKKLGITNYKS